MKHVGLGHARPATRHWSNCYDCVWRAGDPPLGDSADDGLATLVDVDMLDCHRCG